MIDIDDENDNFDEVICPACFRNEEECSCEVFINIDEVIE